uniref:Plus3 domain-containing protein n=1 Tax=Haptolina ericina TaxID=156174 RepID=A0A7S3AQ33_9EUKA
METLELRQKIRQQNEQKGGAARREQRGRAATAAAGAKADKLKELAAKREASKQTERERERERSMREEEADEEEEAKNRPARREAQRRPAEEEEEGELPSQVASGMESAADAHNLERIRLKRDQLEKWLNEPYFETALIGSFVRIGIGNREGRPMYRVAEIVGVKDNFRQYALGEKKTTKRLELKIGESKRFFQISYVSNADFEMTELDKYTRIMQDYKLAGKTMSEIENKVTELKACKHEHTYTNEEIDRLVNQNSKSMKMSGTLAFRRAKADTELQEARDHGDVEAVAEAEKKMKEIARIQALEKKAMERKQASSFRISDINNRNREFQREIEEKRGRIELAEASEISAGHVKATDPFKRLPIRPVIYWNVGGAQVEESAKPPAPAPAPAPALEVSVAEAVITGSSLVSPGFKDLLTTPRASDAFEEAEESEEAAQAAEDLAMSFEQLADSKIPKPKSSPKIPELRGSRAAAHDTIDIDIDIEDLPAMSRPAPRIPPVKAERPLAPTSALGTEPRATLSVTDYKRRMGLL